MMIKTVALCILHLCREEYGVCWMLFVGKDHKMSLTVLEEFYCYFISQIFFPLNLSYMAVSVN